MIKKYPTTEDVPFANTLLAPQYATDGSLRERLTELDAAVEYSTRLVEYAQGSEGVTASLEGPEGPATIRARYLVGADGGGSTVRRGAGIAFTGTTDDSDRMIVADVTVSGLPRDRWHVWPRTAGRFMSLCPLPDGTFQLMLKLRPGDPTDLDQSAIDRMVREFVRRTKTTVQAVHWSTVWRPNIRLAERYRSGRVFLAGDAAHVHPPTGGQGLNTGVQDAYNLGWKLGQVLAGARVELLDTYEAERHPVAAGVLGLSTKIYTDLKHRPIAVTERGDEERQLTLTYRGGPLALGEPAGSDRLAAGDRAPDAPFVTVEGSSGTLFDVLRGPQFTLVAIGPKATEAAQAQEWPAAGATLQRILLDASRSASFRRIYGIDTQARILVRPDGYIAYIAAGNWARTFPEHAQILLPHPDS
ncbi:FAD-dependent monooxygenase [Brevibacterium picturae]